MHKPISSSRLLKLSSALAGDVVGSTAAGATPESKPGASNSSSSALLLFIVLFNLSIIHSLPSSSASADPKYSVRKSDSPC